MTTSQWPLTAAASQVLYELAWVDPLYPDFSGRGALRLGLKELLARGAFEVDIRKRAIMRDKVTLRPGASTPLPPSLGRLADILRPHTPDKLQAVLRSARFGDPHLEFTVRRLFLSELRDRGLVEERHDPLPRRARPVISSVWVRTEAGEAWAAVAAQHLNRLRTLHWEAQSDPATAVQVATTAGALVLVTPYGVPTLARLARVSAGDEAGAASVAPASGVAAFNVVAAVGAFLDSAVEGGLDAVGDAVDAVAGSVDSAIDSAVSGGFVDGGGDGGDAL